MRKIVLLTFCITILLISSSCSVVFFPIHMEGIYESESPRMRIIAIPDYSTFGKNGEIYYDDGSIQKIVFRESHKSFYIFKYREDGFYGIDDTDILYRGTCRQKGDNIILSLDDKNEIVLKKVADLPETSLPTSSAITSSSNPQ